MSEPLTIDERITLPADELVWTATRSSGKGGQNVNKVSSKVELRFALSTTNVLDFGARSRLRALAASYLDANGDLLIKSEKTRDQPKNLADAREKLRDLVARSLVVPKRRRPTKPSRGAKMRRLDDKKRQGDKKRARSATD